MNIALPVRSIGVRIFGILIRHLFDIFSFELSLALLSSFASNTRLSMLVFGDSSITSVIIWSSMKQATSSDCNNCSNDVIILSVLTSTFEVLILFLQKKERILFIRFFILFFIFRSLSHLLLLYGIT